MILRENLEKREFDLLSKYATKSGASLGRSLPEAKCEVRTDFQRDRDRIIHSKAFRRLMHKTQVFLAPEDDHYRTRLTHTLEVSQIARTITRSLNLNEDLAEAIALGHDLGHTPFGHVGEQALNKAFENGFKHNVQSIRVVEVVEDSHGKKGMNLTKEVKDGILNHTGKGKPFTLEGQIVKTSDRIAYINHDIDDAIRSGILKESDLPQEALLYLGQDHRTRINTLVTDMIKNSDNMPEIRMSDEATFHMTNLREFMFDNVYMSQVVKNTGYAKDAEKMIIGLYEFYKQNPNMLPEIMSPLLIEFGPSEVAKDFVAGMTDRYAINTYNEVMGLSKP